jgi:hypothetical protein
MGNEDGNIRYADDELNQFGVVSLIERFVGYGAIGRRSRNALCTESNRCLKRKVSAGLTFPPGQELFAQC